MAIKWMKSVQDIGNHVRWNNELVLFSYTIRAHSFAEEFTLLQEEAWELPEKSTHFWLKIQNLLGFWFDVLFQQIFQHEDVSVLALALANVMCESFKVHWR